MKYFLLLGLATMCVVQGATAQGFSRFADLESTTSYFVHAQPGDATIQVYALGTIRLPGVYEVTDGTRLDKLITLAGGPGEGATEGRTTRSITIRLYRTEGTARTLAAEMSFAELLQASGPAMRLQEDDVVHVETIVRRRFGWRDGLTLVTAAASLTLAIERIASATR